MDVYVWGIVCILILIVGVLTVKVYLLRKAAREIKEKFTDRIHTETNTLIDLSSCDGAMCELADTINKELRRLRSDRLRFQQGDLELKETIANISHDLRTPLTAICGYLDLLKKEEKSETADRYLSVIESRIDILKNLTEELFRYSIITSTVHKISEEELTLNSVLEESISAYYAVLKGCKITPEISIPEQKIRRSLNKNGLLRIFGNIISNAVKYSDGDLKIVLSENGEIIFSNHASRLDEIQVGRLFDRFYTVETGRKSTGLGLSIAKALTEQMDGTITASYQDGIVSIQILFK